MIIKIDRKNKSFHFQDQNVDGIQINMDANPEIGIDDTKVDINQALNAAFA